MSVSQRHQRIAATFTARVEGVTDWDAVTPVGGWQARDVVAHLLDWLGGFLRGGGVELPGGPAVSEDPVEAWRTRAVAVQSLLEDPDRAVARFVHPRVPQQSLAEAIDSFYTSDVLMHTWDLARASGQDDRLDAAECEAMLAGMEPIEELLRTSGQYGARVTVTDGSDATDRLMGFIGRDPAWRPPKLS